MGIKFMHVLLIAVVVTALLWAQNNIAFYGNITA